jgi:uncharacterized protein YjiS (DUF1127 family)
MSRTSIAAQQPFANASELRWASRTAVLLIIARAVAGAAAAIIAWHAERRRVRHAITELSSLSDYMLKDMGIHRHDIPRLAREGRDAMEFCA